MHPEVSNHNLNDCIAASKKIGMLIEVDATTKAMEDPEDSLSYASFMPSLYIVHETYERASTTPGANQQTELAEALAFANEATSTYSIDTSASSASECGNVHDGCQIDDGTPFQESEPQDVPIIVPTALDVLFGKGGTMNHVGNRLFREECKRRAPPFLQNPSSKVEDAIALDLVNFVIEQGGRFLVKVSGMWAFADFDKVLHKAKQLLRDAKKKMGKLTMASSKKHTELPFSDSDTDSPDVYGSASPSNHRKAMSATQKAMKPKTCSTKLTPKCRLQKKPAMLLRQQKQQMLTFASKDCSFVSSSDESCGSEEDCSTVEPSSQQVWICLASSKAKRLFEMIENLENESIDGDISRLTGNIDCGETNNKIFFQAHNSTPECHATEDVDEDHFDFEQMLHQTCSHLDIEFDTIAV